MPLIILGALIWFFIFRKETGVSAGPVAVTSSPSPNYLPPEVKPVDPEVQTVFTPFITTGPNNGIPLNVGQTTGPATAPTGVVKQIGTGPLIDTGNGIVTAGTIIQKPDGTLERWGKDAEGNPVMISGPQGTVFPPNGTVRYDDNGNPNGVFTDQGWMPYR